MREATLAQISSYGQTPKQLFKDKHPPKNIQKLGQAIADCVFSHPEQLSAYPIGSGTPVGSIVFVNEMPMVVGPRRVRSLLLSFYHNINFNNRFCYIPKQTSTFRGEIGIKPSEFAPWTPTRSSQLSRPCTMTMSYAETWQGMADCLLLVELLAVRKE